MAGRIQDKVAIVTGGGSGIGRAIALRFGAEGAKVIVADINEAAAGKVAQEIGAAGGTAMAIRTDVSDEASVANLFDRTVAAHGTVDVLVNNAGLVDTERHFLDGDAAWWDRIIAVNLRSVFLCSHRAAHIMARKGDGSIINVSSGGASKAHRGNSAYDAAKGGIEALTRAMCLDLGPYGVRVNTLVPGSIDSKGMSAEARQYRAETIPLGRVGEPDDLAGPALFLASDDAKYVTGQVTVSDGGMLAQQRSPQVDIFPHSKYPKLS
ncbi:MAG: SDR family NAD(P)-dependent oxidoreductase [Chloroflexota bacterium]